MVDHDPKADSPKKGNQEPLYEIVLVGKAVEFGRYRYGMSVLCLTLRLSRARNPQRSGG